MTTTRMDVKDKASSSPVELATQIVTVLGVITLPLFLLRRINQQRRNRNDDSDGDSDNNTSSCNNKNTNQNRNATRRPPHVRSYIPYVGSAIEMGKLGIEVFIRKYYAAFSNTPIFTATVLGDKCVFIADPEYLTTIFKASIQKNLDTDSLQKQFTTNVLTMTKEEVDETYQPTGMKKATKQYHHYLFQPEELERSTTLAQQYFKDLVPTLVVDPAAVPNDNEWTTHDLYSMVANAIFKASAGPFLSTHMIKNNNNNDTTTTTTTTMMSNFQTFEKGIIKLFNNIPTIFLKECCNARSKLIQFMECDEFWNEASPLMKEREQTLGYSRRTLSKANLGILFASVGNSTPAVFWTLLHLIEDGDAWDACKAQVDDIQNAKLASKEDGSNSSTSTEFFTLQDLDQMTLIDSAFKEALRLYQGSFTTRVVIKDFIIETKTGNYIIPSGSKLMSWWGMLNNDPYVHGDNHTKFIYNRFVVDDDDDDDDDHPKKVYRYKSGKVLTHPPLITFGGGSHLCPGRKFISYEIKLFIAILMTHFDIRLCDGETRPQVDFEAQGIGISTPKGDVKVELRLRK